MHVFGNIFNFYNVKNGSVSLVSVYFSGSLSTFFVFDSVICLPETLTKLLFCHLLLQVPTDAGVDTLIPLSLQGKDNPILQQLLPTLLNPAVLGELLLSACSISL